MVEENFLLFQTIFEQSPISTQVFSLDGETIMVNKAWESLWGVPFTKIKSYNILSDSQLVATGTMPLIKRGFKGEVVHLPAIRYEPSKTVNVKGLVPFRWLSATMYPIRDQQQKLLYVVLQHQDITERKAAEESKYRLAAIVEHSEDAIVSKNLEGVITSWNQGAEQLFGYTASEAIGQNIIMIIPTHLRSEEKDIIRKIKQGERTGHFETVRRRKDGSLVEVSINISPIKNDQGQIIGASKIARNISAEKEIQKRIQESEERLRLALHAGKIGVWDWNISTQELTWTDNVYTIHGVSPDTFTVTYAAFQRLIHPEDTVRVEQELKKSITHHTPFTLEFRIVTPEGQIRWVSTRAITSYDAQRQPWRMLGATSDITKQKELDLEKNDFLSLAAHELKTPLTSMTIFIELLKAEIAQTNLEKPQYYINRIRDQAEKLKELTTDLLDVSRIENR